MILKQEHGTKDSNVKINDKCPLNIFIMWPIVNFIICPHNSFTMSPWTLKQGLPLGVSLSTQYSNLKRCSYKIEEPLTTENIVSKALGTLSISVGEMPTRPLAHMELIHKILITKHIRNKEYKYITKKNTKNNHYKPVIT